MSNTINYHVNYRNVTNGSLRYGSGNMCTEKNVTKSPKTYSCVKQSPCRLVVDNILYRCGVPTPEQPCIFRPILNSDIAFQFFTILPQKAPFNEMNDKSYIRTQVTWNNSCVQET